MLTQELFLGIHFPISLEIKTIHDPIPNPSTESTPMPILESSEPPHKRSRTGTGFIDDSYILDTSRSPPPFPPKVNDFGIDFLSQYEGPIVELLYPEVSSTPLVHLTSTLRTLISQIQWTIWQLSSHRKRWTWKLLRS